MTPDPPVNSDPMSAPDPAGTRFGEEYLARALAQAQRIARAKGYVRSAAPSWGLEETRPSLGSLTGTSEASAIELGQGNESGGAEAEETGEDGGGVHDKPGDTGALGEFGGDLHALERARIRARSKWAKAPGMAAMHLKFKDSRPIGSVLASMVKKNQWDTPTKMGSIMAKWPAIVGPQVAEHSEVETFENQTLIIRCSSTAWAKQLHLLLATIERRIDEEVGPGVVTQVIIRGPVAPSWRKGPLSVPGRGPRDTYG